MKILKIFTNQYFWLSLVVLLAFLVRLYKIDSPIADWHSWRQADTAAVTRNFIKEDFNPLLPKFDDMSGVSEHPLPNLGRFRFVEFPIYNMAVYPFYLLFGVNETYHRLVSVIFSLGSTVFVFFLAKRYLGKFLGFVSALIFALLPYNVFFSRTTLPEPTFVFFALGMVYFFDRWVWEGGKKLKIWSFIFISLAFLVKPWAIFFLIPLLYSIIKKNGKIPLNYLVFIFFALLPFLLWRLWILQAPEGIPASSWLLNSDNIRFKPSFWWWIISERIGREILGVSGAFLFFLGLLIRPKNGNFFLHIFALSIFLYFIIFATGNVRHDYYQIIFVPIASIFVAKGFLDLIKGNISFIPRIWTIALALLFLPLTFYFGWVQVKGLYQINNPSIVEVGKRADQILPHNGVVLAPYNGDTAFLYQVRRTGFPIAAFPIRSMIAEYGVTHYVSVNFDPKTQWVMRHFKVIEQTPKYVIADLTNITSPLDDTLDPEP